MRKTLALVAFSTSVLLAESPGISGVWKADLQRSKFPGPPITNYLAIIEQKEAIFNQKTQEKAPQVTDLSAATGERGEQRSTLSFFNNGKPIVRPYQGIPTRLIGSSDGNTVTVTGEVAGRPATLKRVYELSPDGQTLTITTDSIAEGKEQKSLIVLLRQPDQAGDPLRKPEETAGVHFKNVKTDSLKVLPQSEFLNTMRYFSWSLGKDCEFCHVQHHFDSDDKKEKKTARKMIDMVAAIDQNNFEGHPEVRCFTCHEAHPHPPSRPSFPDEVTSAEAGQKSLSAAPGH